MTILWKVQRSTLEHLESHRIRSKTRARLPVLCWHLRLLCVWFMQLLHGSTVLDSPKYALLSGPLSLTWGEEAGTSELQLISSYYCVRASTVCEGGMPTTVWVWRIRGQLVALVFSFNLHVVVGTKLRFGGKCVFLLSQLVDNRNEFH